MVSKSTFTIDLYFGAPGGPGAKGEKPEVKPDLKGEPGAQGGSGLPAAVGFASAVGEGTLSRTIVTSLTVFMTCLALLFFGGVVLKEFALALTIGVIVGTYSSVFVASPIVAVWRGEKMVEVKRS